MGGLDSGILADILRESMSQGQFPGITLTSNSMYPLLKTGDRISIEAVAPSDLQYGDIITLIDDSDRSQLLTHRFWGKQLDKNKWWLLTRGDRPLEFDTPFAASNLVGRVIDRQRNQRQLNLQTGSGAWLNGWLTKVAAADLRRLTGVEWKEAASNPIALTRKSNKIVREEGVNGRFQRSRRLWRKIYLARSIIVTSLISWFSHIIPQKQL